MKSLKSRNHSFEQTQKFFSKSNNVSIFYSSAKYYNLIEINYLKQKTWLEDGSMELGSVNIANPIIC